MTDPAERMLLRFRCRCNDSEFLGVFLWVELPFCRFWSHKSDSIWLNPMPTVFTCYALKPCLDMSAAMTASILHWFLTIPHYYIAFVGPPIVTKYRFLTDWSWFKHYHIAQVGSPSIKASMHTIRQLHVQIFLLSHSSFITIRCKNIQGFFYRFYTKLQVGFFSGRKS